MRGYGNFGKERPETAILKRIVPGKGICSPRGRDVFLLFPRKMFPTNGRGGGGGGGGGIILI